MKITAREYRESPRECWHVSAFGVRSVSGVGIDWEIYTSTEFGEQEFQGTPDTRFYTSNSEAIYAYESATYCAPAYFVVNRGG